MANKKPNDKSLENLKQQLLIAETSGDTSLAKKIRIIIDRIKSIPKKKTIGLFS